MATYTYYGTTASGSVQNVSGGTYADCRNDSAGDSNGNSSINVRSRGDEGGDNEWKIDRGFAIFDTSGIPDNITISSSVLKLYCTSKNTGGDLRVMLPSNPASNTTLINDDFDQAGTTQNSATAYASITTSAWNSIAIATPNTNISKTGYTKIGLRHSHDVDDTGQNNGDYNFVFYGGANATYKPVLEVVWTTAPAVTTGAVTDLKSVTATLGGNITDAGGGTVSTAGVCWAITANPTTASSKTATATTTGAFTVGATGLIAGQLYHYRAYVTTENSTTYGTDLTFRTIFGGNFIPFL